MTMSALLFQQLSNLCCEINQNSPMKGIQDYHQVKQHAYNALELRPSGPRHKDLGIDQTKQGIMHAQMAADGSVVLKVTLLAAGFVVGPKGATIQKVCQISGARSKSWFIESGNQANLRVFYIEGHIQAVLDAVQTIIQAVNRYKELIEGKYRDQVVAEKQLIRGIVFEYKPPPIHTIPVAARTKIFSGAPPSVYGYQKVAQACMLKPQSSGELSDDMSGLTTRVIEESTSLQSNEQQHNLVIPSQDQEQLNREDSSELERDAIEGMTIEQQQVKNTPPIACEDTSNVSSSPQVLYPTTFQSSPFITNSLPPQFISNVSFFPTYSLPPPPPPPPMYSLPSYYSHTYGYPQSFLNYNAAQNIQQQQNQYQHIMNMQHMYNVNYNKLCENDMYTQAQYNSNVYTVQA